MTAQDLKRKIDCICDEEDIYLSGEVMDDIYNLLSDYEADDARVPEGVIPAVFGMLIDNAWANTYDYAVCIDYYIANTDVLSANVIKNVVLPFS